MDALEHDHRDGTDWDYFERQIETMRERIIGLHRQALSAGPDDHTVLAEAFQELSVSLVELQVADQELRSAREQLEAERQRYHDLFEFAPDAYLVTDAGGNIREANRATTTLLHRPQAQLAGKPLVTYVAVTDRRALRSRLGHLQALEHPHQWEMHVQPAHAAPIPVSVIAGPIDDRQGNLAGILWLLRDIRERQRAEAERLQLVREQAARSQAEAALHARTEFLASISHDLRSPLTTLKGTAQILHRKALREDANPADLVLGLEDIVATVNRLTAMVGQLFDLAQLDTGQSLELDREPTDLVTLVQQVAASEQKLTDRHRISVDAAIPEVVGNWDPVRLQRVVANLIENAVKYSPNGGAITIHVRRHHDTEGGWASVAVRDEGIGIPAADLSHVVEGFRRGSNVVGRIAGTGVGLVGARRIVEQHGGRLTIESTEGSGTTVTIRLPLG
jgi:PAS domain S-box-containing protein